MARQGLDLPTCIARLAGRLGHVQFADCPGRGAPGSGTLDFVAAREALVSSGYQAGWAPNTDPARPAPRRASAGSSNGAVAEALPGISPADGDRQPEEQTLESRSSPGWRVAGTYNNNETDNMQPSTQAANAWRVLFLLFLANLFNFFDRTIPAIITEPIRLEWNLNDFQLGLIGTAFTIIYAIAGVPLGRMADSGSRRKIMGWGLTVWSGLTAVNGLAWNFWSFLLIRMGIGVGEASYAPAANSLIGDLFPAHKRARAMGVFMLGLPLGLLLAFFTIGSMVEAFGSWRAPFFIAAVPGLVLALFLFFIREPERGAAESVKVAQTPVENPVRKVLAIPTFWWLVLAGLAFNFATYACNAFMVPLLMRYFGAPLVQASVATGVIVGLTG